MNCKERLKGHLVHCRVLEAEVRLLTPCIQHSVQGLAEGEISQTTQELGDWTGVGQSHSLPESLPGIHRNPPTGFSQETVIPMGEEQMEPVLFAPATNNNDNNSNNHNHL